MKRAFLVTDKDCVWGVLVVFADNANKAKEIALFEDEFTDCKYIDLRAHREPKLDIDYNGHAVMDWNDPDDRFALVMALDWYCADEWFDPDECKKCSAQCWCAKYEEYCSDQKGEAS